MPHFDHKNNLHLLFYLNPGKIFATVFRPVNGGYLSARFTRAGLIGILGACHAIR
jgi:hypothetical protein